MIKNGINGTFSGDLHPKHFDRVFLFFFRTVKRLANKQRFNSNGWNRAITFRRRDEEEEEGEKRKSVIMHGQQNIYTKS